MNTRSRSSPPRRVLCAGLSLLLAVGCSESRAAPDAQTDGAPPLSGALTDQPLEAYRGAWLDVAFKAASSYPSMPHIKSRCRAQESVVEACLELDQPRRALACIEKIDNWQRGTGYADLAFYCARHGDVAGVPHLLDLADEVANRPVEESSQDWQRDRIRAGIARTHAWLGQAEQAELFAKGITPSEAGALAKARAMQLGAEDFDAELETLQAGLAASTFDEVRNALGACAQLFDRFHDDADRRARVLERIRGSWSKMPAMVRLELMMDLARTSLDHQDPAEALGLIAEAHVALDGSQWIPGDRIPLQARLAGLRGQAGEKDQAQAEARAALADLEAAGPRVVDIERAGVLRAIAEAFQAMGEPASALVVYRQAVEAGVQNPNSRPRADDLVATCCSLALHGVQADDALRSRVAEIASALGPPW